MGPGSHTIRFDLILSVVCAQNFVWSLRSPAHICRNYLVQIFWGLMTHSHTMTRELSAEHQQVFCLNVMLEMFSSYFHFTFKLPVSPLGRTGGAGKKLVQCSTHSTVKGTPGASYAVHSTSFHEQCSFGTSLHIITRFTAILECPQGRLVHGGLVSFLSLRFRTWALSLRV